MFFDVARIHVKGGDGGNGFTAISIDSATIGGNTLQVGTIKIEKV